MIQRAAKSPEAAVTTAAAMTVAFEAEGIGEDSGHQGTGGVADVAPEAVRAQSVGTPGGVGVAGDGRDEGRIDMMATLFVV